MGSTDPAVSLLSVRVRWPSCQVARIRSNDDTLGRILVLGLTWLGQLGRNRERFTVTVRRKVDCNSWHFVPNNLRHERSVTVCAPADGSGTLQNGSTSLCGLSLVRVYKGLDG